MLSCSSEDGDEIEVSSDKVENWSQSPNREDDDASHVVGDEKIDHSLNPFAPDYKSTQSDNLFAKASEFRQGSNSNNGSAVSFIEIESYENLRSRAEVKSREAGHTKRQLRLKTLECDQVEDDLKTSNRKIFVLKRDIRHLMDRVDRQEI